MGQADLPAASIVCPHLPAERQILRQLSGTLAVLVGMFH
jgi:hypothetical protein